MPLRAVCVAAFLVGITEGLFFELKSAAKECFKTDPSKGHFLIGSYEADGPVEGVTVTLNNPSDKIVWKSTESSAKLNLEATVDGAHSLCFESTVSQGQMVSFNFRVDEHGDEVSLQHKEFVTKDHTDKVGELVAQLEARAADILDQQQYTITREAVHRDTAESTNSRVMWWTVMEVLSLISLAAFQVYYLRSYFEVKQVV
eukprot:gnl/TRDRNA2_/TRDRNA2_84262_c0_seq1.p2 gnl/TRDRNA2_/TRDRNA2_84262_c0~~gnl/TRDRNA2_/TRDRNA2_84262_c0_seq1.p2  ORF type:complete len:201 (+),score=48.92 gnl/TRDRNA2_/TRDRNA2_84262_c0_seq1:36-638(+)